MEPQVIQMERGGWLAITGPDAPAPIGVFGTNRAGALAELDRAVRHREELRAAATTR